MELRRRDAPAGRVGHRRHGRRDVVAPAFHGRAAQSGGGEEGEGMTATILRMHQPAVLECSTCAAPVEAACNCGVAYVPRASARATKTNADNPGMSVRTLAKKAGVSVGTAHQAKKADVQNRTVAIQVAQPAVALADDFLSPADADRTIRTIVE